MKKIRVLIRPDGKATVSVEGVQGQSCTDLTKALEAAIGEVEERKLCDAYHEEVSETAAEQVNENL